MFFAAEFILIVTVTVSLISYALTVYVRHGELFFVLMTHRSSSVSIRSYDAK